MNARQVLLWVKANVFIVVFGVVMIAALVALPILSGNMNKDVASRVSKQLSSKRELEQLGRQSVNLAVAGSEDRSWQTAINESLIEGIQTYLEAEAADAEAIVAAAVEYNRKGRDGVMPDRFPPVGRMSETLPGQFAEAMNAAYDDLLDRVHAGGPLGGELPAERLQRQRRQFITSRLQKAESDALTTAEAEGLAENLAAFRLGLASEAADAVAFYCERTVLPEFDPTAYVDDQHTLFGWQWDYWVAEDVLEAIAATNRDEDDPERRSARIAPVKRVVALEIGGLPAATDAVPPTAAPADGNEIQPSYDVSLTGRVTNPLYDVRRVRLHVIAETRRLPMLFDALAERNFITVLDADVKPADPWAAVAAGYYYGNEPVSDVVLDLETVWLRAWTKDFMPTVTRGTLGVWTPAEGTNEGGA